jgi:hypothetical protein
MMKKKYPHVTFAFVCRYCLFMPEVQPTTPIESSKNQDQRTPSRNCEFLQILLDKWVIGLSDFKNMSITILQTQGF